MPVNEDHKEEKSTSAVTLNKMKIKKLIISEMPSCILQHADYYVFFVSADEYFKRNFHDPFSSSHPTQGGQSI